MNRRIHLFPRDEHVTLSHNSPTLIANGRILVFNYTIFSGSYNPDARTLIALDLNSLGVRLIQRRAELLAAAADAIVYQDALIREGSTIREGSAVNLLTPSGTARRLWSRSTKDQLFRVFRDQTEPSCVMSPNGMFIACTDLDPVGRWQWSLRTYDRKNDVVDVAIEEPVAYGSYSEALRISSVTDNGTVEWNVVNYAHKTQRSGQMRIDGREH
jgi:hypothetical protein